jgi:hypothetical protein
MYSSSSLLFRYRRFVAVLSNSAAFLGTVLKAVRLSAPHLAQTSVFSEWASASTRSRPNLIEIRFFL